MREASARVRVAKSAIATKGGELYGLPAKLVRDAMRACRYGWDEHEVAKVLGEKARPEQLRARLVADGFLNPEGELTSDGLAVMGAKATRRIPRAKADEALRKLLQRVEWVNKHSRYAYVVKRVVVFGSYLSDAPNLGDLDVMVEYARRFDDKEAQDALEKERRESARKDGRDLGDFMTHLSWPSREPELYLKARDRVLSFVGSDHAEWLEERPYKVVYTLDHPTPLPPAPPSTCCTQGHENAPGAHTCVTCREGLTDRGRQIVEARRKLLAHARRLLTHEDTRAAIRARWAPFDIDDDFDVTQAVRVLADLSNDSQAQELRRFSKDLEWSDSRRFWREGPSAELEERIARLG